MPIEAVFAVIAVFVGLPWATFSGLAKLKAASGNEKGGGLRASELEAIIRAAVEDAMAPMQRRIETLEAIVTDDEPASERRLDPAVLADVLEPGAPAESGAARRRTRE